MGHLRLYGAFIAGFMTLSGPAAAMEGVVASIKPVHSLVAAVMGDVGTPELLVPDNASPHTYALRPSDAAKLEKAKIVFWVGEGLETFLEKPLGSLAVGATSIALAQSPGLTLFDLREGGAFDYHAHEEEEGDHAHRHDPHDGEEDEHGAKAKDMHFWLDPENARLVAKHIAATLSSVDPDNAEIYHENAAELDQKLVTLIAETRQRLESVREKPFIVFHDAYHYFEDRFGLEVAGSITVNPDAPPSAHRVREIQDKIIETGASCVFAEPQFEPRVIRVVMEGSSARAGELDPIGADIDAGPELYFQLISRLAASFSECLSQ